MPEKKDDFHMLKIIFFMRNAEVRFLLNYFIFRSFGIVIHTPIPTSDNKNL